MKIVVVLLVMAMSSAAFAGAEEARTAFEQERYGDAAREYEAAYEADGTPEMALGAALSYQRLGDCEHARRRYSIYRAARSGAAAELRDCPEPEARVEEVHETRGYADSLMRADFLGLGAAVGGVGMVLAHSPVLGVPMILVGGIAYAFGAPSVHVRHRHPDRALLDLGLRVAIPAVTGWLGAKAGCGGRGGEECGFETGLHALE